VRLIWGTADGSNEGTKAVEGEGLGLFVGKGVGETEGPGSVVGEGLGRLVGNELGDGLGRPSKPTVGAAEGKKNPSKVCWRRCLEDEVPLIATVFCGSTQ